MIWVFNESVIQSSLYFNKIVINTISKEQCGGKHFLMSQNQQ